MNKPLRTALLGGGISSAVGRVHDIALRMDHKFELVAGCFSRDAEINVASGNAYRINSKRVYSNYQSLLESEFEELDVVVVALPTQEHAKAIKSALSYNLTVITDKPTVSRLDEAQDLLQQLGENTRRLFTLFNYTGYPIVREIRNIIKQKKIGNIFKLMIEMPQDGFLRMSNTRTTQGIQSWRLKDGEICGLSLDLFTHIHSLVRFMTNAKPIGATARMRSISQVAPGLIDDVDALIDYDNGMSLNAWYGKAALGYRNGLRIRVFGTKGSLEWLQVNPEQLLWSDEEGDIHIKDRLSSSSNLLNQGRYDRFKAGHPSGFIEAFANYYADIADVINNQAAKNENVLSLKDAVEGLALAELLQKNQCHLQ